MPRYQTLPTTSFTGVFRSLVNGRLVIAGLIVGALVLFAAPSARAFCGFYVGSAGSKLYNQASQVAIARVEDRTTITMRNDYKGPPNDFALIVPVPVVLGEEDVRTVPGELFDRLDTYTAPRLVEYKAKDPCWFHDYANRGVSNSLRRSGGRRRVTVEAEFSVDEYDIQILSATESEGLETWLREQGYNIPKGAARILAPYIKQQVKFFAAKVDSSKLKRTPDGGIVLSPLQFTFKAPGFGLPIRLGMINATGVQDLIIYALTPPGLRTVVTNYPNPTIPTNIELGASIPKQKEGESQADAFGRYYLRLFNTAQDKAGGAAVLTEYAWDSSKCDPCPTTPLTSAEMAALGVEQGAGVVTRLHARYTNRLFKDDIKLDVTQHQSNFQGRYILRHPWTGKVSCDNPRDDVDQQLRPMIGGMSKVASKPVTLAGQGQPNAAPPRSVRLRGPQGVEWLVDGKPIGRGNRVVQLAGNIVSVAARDLKLEGVMHVPIRNGIADLRRVREGRLQVDANPAVANIRIGTMVVKSGELMTLREGTYVVHYTSNRLPKQIEVKIDAGRSKRVNLR